MLMQRTTLSTNFFSATKAFSALLLFSAVLLASSTFAQPGPDPVPTYTVNFKDADIQEVIKFVADVTERNMVVDPRVKGRVKVISKTELNEVELLELFRSVLQVHDYTMIEVGNVIRILPLKEARSSPVRVVKKNFVPEKTDNGFITQVIQLENVDATKVLPVLRPLVPQHSHLAAYSPSNAIVLTDTAPNIERIRRIIQKIDLSALPETEVIILKYANADEMVTTLSKLTQKSAQEGPSTTRFQMVADKRNNAVILTGEDVQRRRIKELLQTLDRPNSQSGNVRVVYLEYADAKNMAQILSKVVQNLDKVGPANQSSGSSRTSSRRNNSGATVEADEDTNALLITANGDELQALLAVIDRLDVRRAQVLVEAIIVELSLTNDEALGVEWLFTNSDSGVVGGSTSGSSTLGRNSGLATGILGEDLSDTERAQGLLGSILGTQGQILGVGGTTDGDAFLAVLNALNDSSKANILSTPSIMTMDNNEAKLSIGQNVPFSTGSFSSTGNTGGGISSPFTTIQREDVGISLTVTPQINEGDKIILKIEQEVSSINGNPSVDAQDIITNQRKFETQLIAADGEVVVLGGLIEDNVQDSVRKVPLLGDIPILGNLFKVQGTNRSRSNLMVFLRAKVVRDDQQLRGATAEKYKHIRDVQLEQRAAGLSLMNRDVLPLLPDIDWNNMQLPDDAVPGITSDQ